MNLHLVVLKAFLVKDLYQKYSKYIDYKFIKENYPELYRLYNCLEQLHHAEREHKTVNDLELVFATQYPRSNTADYTPIFRNLTEVEYDPAQMQDYLKQVATQAQAAHLARISLGVAEGTTESSKLSEAIQEFSRLEVLDHDRTDASEFVTSDLGELLSETQAESGLRWPIASINRNLGSLRKGDFGFVFARPETGKTTFLATAVPYMAGQSERPALWFNNEEQGNKVLIRCYQSVLGLTLPQLYADIPGYTAKYREKTRDNVKIINDASITKKRVEELCARYNPSLIIFDQIDKIHGFQADRADLELKEIYVWARELAKQYAPVIAVCQAGVSGEGKQWLTMGDVDNSKTGKQGEADWIMGIGRKYDEGLEGIRYLHLSKNKLIGDNDADPTKRHGKWEVRIRPEIARYEDF